MVAGPAPGVVVHAYPPEGSEVMPCCGRSALERPDERVSVYADRVTCRGAGGVEGPVVSPWVRPGWFVASCSTCRTSEGGQVGFETVRLRDKWAADHAAGTGHVVRLLDGEAW